MTFDQDNLDDSTSNLRKQRRQQEDKKRMAYRRAIEEYRESKALHALVQFAVGELPALAAQRRPSRLPQTHRMQAIRDPHRTEQAAHLTLLRTIIARASFASSAL